MSNKTEAVVGLIRQPPLVRASTTHAADRPYLFGLTVWVWEFSGRPTHVDMGRRVQLAPLPVVTLTRGAPDA